MTKSTTLPFNPELAAAPIYVTAPSIETTKATYGAPEVIKMGSNESPLPPSPLAIAAMQEAVTGLNRYPSIGDETLRVALSEALGRGLEADNFVTGNGGLDILNMLSLAFLRPGNEAVICRPTFPIYDIYARRIGAKVVYVDLNPRHFLYDVEAILAAVTEQTRLVYVCSPNNPTGTVTTDEQMETLVNNLPPHVLLVADEVYYNFADDGGMPDTLKYVLEGRNIMMIHSFSKVYGLAGLRLGYAIAPVEIARYLSRARMPFHLDAVTFAGGIAALQDIQHKEMLRQMIFTGRDFLFQQFTKMDVRAWPSQGNFILFKPAYPADEVSERMLKRGIIVRPMTQFYLPTHLRVTIGLPEENQKFITALKEVLAELKAEGAPKATAQADSGGDFKF